MLDELMASIEDGREEEEEEEIVIQDNTDGDAEEDAEPPRVARDPKRPSMEAIGSHSQAGAGIAS